LRNGKKIPPQIYKVALSLRERSFSRAVANPSGNCPFSVFGFENIIVYFDHLKEFLKTMLKYKVIVHIELIIVTFVADQKKLSKNVI